MSKKRRIIPENQLQFTSSFDEIELEHLIEFLEVGNPENIPPELSEYLRILDIIWRLHKRQFDYPNNQAIINHLMLVYGFKRPKATQLVKDSLKYFYAENNQDNAVNKGILADNGMKSFVLAMKIAKSSRDVKDAFWILLELGKFLGWNVEKEDTENENFIRQIQVVTSNIETFGLEKQDRRLVAQFIDKLPISEKMKEVANAEVDGIPLKLIYGDNPRKEELWVGEFSKMRLVNLVAKQKSFILLLPLFSINS